MIIEGSTCYECKKGKYYFRKYCGAFVCTKCGHHYGMSSCFCGWNIRNADPEAMHQEEW